MTDAAWDYGRIGHRLLMGLTHENECKWMFEGYIIPVFDGVGYIT